MAFFCCHGGFRLQHSNPGGNRYTRDVHIPRRLGGFTAGFFVSPTCAKSRPVSKTNYKEVLDDSGECLLCFKIRPVAVVEPRPRPVAKFSESSSSISGRRLGGFTAGFFVSPASSMKARFSEPGVPLREERLRPHRLQRQAAQSWLEGASLAVCAPLSLPAEKDGQPSGDAPRRWDASRSR